MASMPITSDTFPHPCGNPSSISNRLWACESPPALRATILPDLSLEQCSSTEGDVILQLEENLLARIAATDTTSSLNDGPDSHEMESPTMVYMGDTILQHLEKTLSNQKANQRLGSGGVESNDIIKEDVPIAMRTRGRTKLQHPSKAKKAKKISGKSMGMEKKSLLSQLIQQNKQQQDRLTEMNVMLRKVLELQLSMAREIQEDIEAVVQCSEKNLPLPGPIMVKTPRECETKRLVTVSGDRECGQRSNPAIKMPSTTSSSVIDVTNYADHECGQRGIFGKTVNAVPLTFVSNASIKSGNDKNTCNRVMRKNIKTMLPTSAASDDSDASSCCGARVLMAKATPRKTSMYSSDSLDDSSINGSPRHLDVSGVSDIHDTSPDPIRYDASPIPVTSTQDRRKQFNCPKEPKKDRNTAYERTCNALDQVPDIVHFKKTGLRKTATLYVGNLAFEASEADLSNALSPIFVKIQVENVTIPQRNGRSRGFGFINLSWAAEAPVTMFDICVAQSAMIFVHSRPIYLREVDSKANSASSDQSMAPPYTVAEACAEIAYLKQKLKDQEDDIQQMMAEDNLSDSSI